MAFRTNSPPYASVEVILLTLNVCFSFFGIQDEGSKKIEKFFDSYKGTCTHTVRDGWMQVDERRENE